ncbi:MAG: LPS export ABC transporter permease LptF [Pseudomonadota bacterium]
MIFPRLDRYLMREALLAMLAVSLVLWLVMMANVGVQLVGGIVQGSLPAPLLLGLLSANAVKLLMFILPVGGFLGLLFALGRMYRDHEIPVLLACGASPLRLQRPLMLVVLLWALLIGWLALVAWPAAQTARDNLLQQAMSASVFERLPVGRFLVADKGRVTVYAARVSADGQSLEDVFVHTQLKDAEGVERASRAQFSEDGAGYRQLVLQDGKRFDGVIGQSDWRVLRYAEHRIDLGLEQRDATSAARKHSAMPLSVLLAENTPQAQAELAKRIAQPLSALLLGLLALPLARTKPRQGRFASIGAGVLIYVLYFNLITLGSKAIEDGKLVPLLGVFLPHALMLAFILFMYWRQGAFVRLKAIRRTAHAS